MMRTKKSLRSKPIQVIATLLGTFMVILTCTPVTKSATATGVYRAVFESAGRYLRIEVLADDLVHFELSDDPPQADSIWTSPMVFKTDYPGPSVINLPAAHILETPDLRLTVDVTTLCVSTTDRARSPELFLTTFCPIADSDHLNGLSFTQEGTTDIYGLGEYFQRRGGADGNWLGQRRMVLNPFGNELTKLNGGSVGNAQFPILYALGGNTENYAFFLDNLYQQLWNFRASPFTVKTTGTPLRWYVMTGRDLPDLRGDYLELTGHPPVPPKQMLGLWVSEFGYEDWAEAMGVLSSLKNAKFPVDGMVLDLQWFGGINPRDRSQMGSLAWDESNFRDPVEMIAALRDGLGVSLMVIEESYVSTSARGYDEALNAGVLVKRCAEPTCTPITLDSWWGVGGMVDWTNPQAAAWWHDHRRQHLIDAGVIAHWTDLGEPEDFDETAWYYGFPELERHAHADIHNVYNLLWSQSIWQAYQRQHIERRPFILTRSGTSGSQRFGVSMWSGDIGSNLSSQNTHLNAQMHMSLSGIDYFGSDIGGFYRHAAEPGVNLDDLYTLWLANAALLDIPLRPHTMNLQNAFQTAPSLIGDVGSNLANVRLRYQLSPYLYTLAHRAYRSGEPIFAPLVYYFQDDPEVRAIGSQKMVGDSLMMAAITNNDPGPLPVYLPAGGWFNYYTQEYIHSTGQWFSAPRLVEGLLRAPLFVREGAILPLMVVDDQTLNMLGQRRDGSRKDDLLIQVYLAKAEPHFTLIEDDGETSAYQAGKVRETLITHGQTNSGWFVDVGAASGEYRNAPASRRVRLQLIVPAQTPVAAVMLNGVLLPKGSPAEADSGASWQRITDTLIEVEAGMVDVNMSLHLTFTPAP